MMPIQRRRGTILICILACVLVTTTLITSTIHLALKARNEARLRHRLKQTTWLLDAGVQRAIQKLRERPEYDGEQWIVPESVLVLASGTVDIAVSDEPQSKTGEEGQPNPDSSKRVRVVARLAASPDLHVDTNSQHTAAEPNTTTLQRSYEFVLHL